MGSLMNNQSSSSSSSMSEEEEAFGYAWSLRTSIVFPFVLEAAIQLGVFDILAKAGPDAHISCNDIASQLPTSNNPDAPYHLDRLLRLLACYNLVTCNISENLDESGNRKVGRLYGLALPGKAFASDENGGSLAAFTFDKAKLEVWQHMKDLVLEGEKDMFERVHGVPQYQYLSMNPESARRFDRAMTNLSKAVVNRVVEKYEGFEGITTLIDVGGGYGITLNIIISKYPTIKGINFDMPHVIQEAPSYPGIQHIGGDMFSSIPKSEAIMMKDVLHNWNDECCLKLLKNCYEALPKNGKVIVISFVMFEEPEPSTAAKHICHMDLIMAMRHGAKQRTEHQFKAMAMAAGFSDFQLRCRIFNAVAVMEFYK